MNESDAKGRPKFHQTREANWLLDLLRGKTGRCLKPGTLARWYHARFASLTQDNPRLAQLGLFIDELDGVWGEVGIPASLAIDELYEFSADIALTEKGRLTLSTVHGAKGREFRHVVILDGGNWKQASDDERRLYYVGMTRAQETLSLCETVGRRNPFSSGLADVAVCRSPLPQPLPDCSGLYRRYLSMGLSDVVLGFAGRKLENDPLHACLDRLEYGQGLQLQSIGSSWELRLVEENIVVGRLSGKCTLPAARNIEARVESIIRRHHHQSKPEYAGGDKVDHWYVVVPMLAWTEEAP